MYDNLDTLGDVTLRNLCIPGTHDSGTSVCQDGTFFSPSSDIQTQTLPISAQLELGIRYFDIRPCLTNGKFYTGHYRNIPVLGWQGANGESIDSIIEALNSYTKKNAELVIVGFSYAYNTQNFTVLNQREWGLLFEKLQTVQSAFCIKDASPSADFSTDLTSLTLRKFIGGKKSAVLFIVNDNVDLTKYWGRGMYSSQNFNIFNKYSNINDPETMSGDQLTKMRENSKNSYFLLSWTLTQSYFDAVLSAIFPCARSSRSILGLANMANKTLDKKLLPACTSEIRPNIVLVDNVTESLDIVSLIMKINNLK